MSPIRSTLKTDLRRKGITPQQKIISRHRNGHLFAPEGAGESRSLHSRRSPDPFSAGSDPRGKAEGKISSLPEGRAFYRADRPYSPGGEGVGFPDGG